MECYESVIVIDAAPQDQPNIINQNVCKSNEILETLLDDFTKDDYKSIFFLLMDYVKLDNFFNVTKQNIYHLKQAFYEIYRNFNNIKMLIELFGTLKMYKKLRLLDTCCHVFKNLEDRNFSQIDYFWKMLYALCEELNYNDLNNLKQSVPDNFKGKIESTEDWFCWALLNKVFSKADVSKLEHIFKDYQKCVNILKDFQVKTKLYDIRTPTASSNCGIAVILNFENFVDESNLKKRTWSDVDVELLRDLWNKFGFETKVLTNLTYEDTKTKLRFYATLDHNNHDIFVCCILSHGNLNSVYSSDGRQIPISTLVALISNDNISLALKPKLFFIQACQGTNAHEGIGKPVYNLAKDSDTIEENNSEMIAIASDVLIAKSSIDGFVSYRTKTGSWFVKALCDSMMDYGDKFSVLDVITEVNKQVRRNRADYGPDGPREAQQIVSCSYSLGKTLILKKRV